jgi:FeS assembly SUF system protein
MSDMNEIDQIDSPGDANESGAKPPAPGSGAAAGGPDAIRERVIEQLRTVFDPEIPVNIYELGLIYEVAVDEGGLVAIRMTLTSPMCPAAEQLPPEVESKARSVSGVRDVKLDLIWDPPWNPSMMSEAARLDLGMV